MACIVLGVGASSGGVRALNITGEFRDVKQQILQQAQELSRAAPENTGLSQLWSSANAFVEKHSVSPQDLSNYLTLYKPAVLHISAHGSPEAIYFIVNNNEQRMPNVQLTQTLKLYRTNRFPTLVVLNCCFSMELARSLHAESGVPFIVGTTTDVADAAAIAFSTKFYAQLALGANLGLAFDLAQVSALSAIMPRDARTPTDGDFALYPSAGARDVLIHECIRPGSSDVSQPVEGNTAISSLSFPTIPKRRESDRVVGSSDSRENREGWQQFTPAFSVSEAVTGTYGQRNESVLGHSQVLSRSKTPEPPQKRKPVLESPLELTPTNSKQQHFEFDVYLCFGKADEEVVSSVQEMLAHDGFTIFKNDKQGIMEVEDAFKDIDHGLKNSHVVILFASRRVVASSAVWNQLEFQAQRYHDPWNPERRLIVVRLDSAEIPGMLSKVHYIMWDETKKSYNDLHTTVRACCDTVVKIAQLKLNVGPNGVYRMALSKNADLALFCQYNSSYILVFDTTSGVTGSLRFSSKSGEKNLHDVKWSSNQLHTLTCGDDGIVRLWNVKSSKCESEVSVGGAAYSISWVDDDDTNLFLVGLKRGDIELWEFTGSSSGTRIREFKGHTNAVYTLDVILLSGGKRALLSASIDCTLRIWMLETGLSEHTLRGHTNSVFAAVFRPDGLRAVSGSADKTVITWDVRTGQCLRILEGHTSDVNSVAWHPTCSFLVVSGSHDQTVRVWNADEGECMRVFHGHEGLVRKYFHWSVDGGSVTSCDANGKLIRWNLKGVLANSKSALAQMQYTNAKVLLVGDSGAGKTGLSMRLATDHWTPTESSFGAWSTQWKIREDDYVDNFAGGEREIWLWDFGGQADQRLIHQLFMDDAALAVLVFDGQKENFLVLLQQWKRDIARAAHAGSGLILVAGRIDTGAPRMKKDDLESFANEHKFLYYFETSAKLDIGCKELKKAIVNSINWQKIPHRSTPIIFEYLKKEILAIRHETLTLQTPKGTVSSKVLLHFDELRTMLQNRLGIAAFTEEELTTVLGLLSSPGVVWQLKFGGYVLIQPELVSIYAQGLLRSIQRDPKGRGFTHEADLLNGTFPYADDIPQLDDKSKGRILLLELHHTLLERALCFRVAEHSDESLPLSTGPLLTFPSCFKQQRSDMPSHPPDFMVSYTFNGFVDEAYATLVVRLHHTLKFSSTSLWCDAAEFRTLEHHVISLKVVRQLQDIEFQISCSNVPNKVLLWFCSFVHQHLILHSRISAVIRLRQFYCDNLMCKDPVMARQSVMERIAKYSASERNKPPPSVECVKCEKRVPIWDEIEEQFANPDLQQIVRDLEEHARTRLQEQANQRVLSADVISIVLQANQMVTELLVPKFGASLEVTFRPVPDSDSPNTGRILVILCPEENVLRSSDDIYIESELLRHAPEWSKCQDSVIIVCRVFDNQRAIKQLLWMGLKGKSITAGRLKFVGQLLDTNAVVSWHANVGAGASSL